MKGRAADKRTMSSITNEPLAAPNVQDEILSIRNLDLIYGSTRGPVTAVKDFSLNVRRGEFVSILGPSGCGKSTLLKVVSGLLSPTAGLVSLNGRDVTGPRADTGVVFQQPTLLPWKSVLENVLVPIRALRRPVGEYRNRAVDLLKLVGLGDFLNHYPHELSGGMQQRVGIARGLIHDPMLLLMDEPFAALDAMSREFMMLELQRIWMSTKKSVIFITHSIPEAVFLSDRVVTMSARPGRVIDEHEIKLARPREARTMGSTEFGAYCNHFRNLFGTQAS